ncbi:uncharacterized protein LOC129282952 [Lytechinus pictus]|uniref:uncharacterized protein LOC129282952 n=1 Tax=Lytechinus pictus TaxID=7653 RepID=UPI0030BA2245
MVDRVPIIDFSAYSLDRENPVPEEFPKLIDDVHNALTTIGFMYLKNCGIPVQTIEDAFHYSKKFFLLPTETKMKYVRPQNTNHGYVQLEREGLNPDRPFNDLKEAFNCTTASEHRPYPDEELPEFRTSLSGLFEVLVPLHNRILEVMARGLQLEDPQFFVERHKFIGTLKSNSTLRTLYYPSLDNVEVKEDQVRCGEHSDYGGITLLFQDPQPGLEVRNLEDKWIPAKPIEGTVVVNIGDLMQRWTSDKLIASKHRVMIPLDQIKRQQVRQSMAFFGHPDNDAVIECINNSNKYPPTTGLKYLDMRFAATYSGVTKLTAY